MYIVIPDLSIPLIYQNTFTFKPHYYRPPPTPHPTQIQYIYIYIYIYIYTLHVDDAMSIQDYVIN